jgi:molybdopterin converting factor small subunit
LARLRLFAQARECAGIADTSVEAATVGEVLDAAAARYGPRFEAICATSTVWLNGESANRACAVGEDDEVAVLPPVSGG